MIAYLSTWEYTAIGLAVGFLLFGMALILPSILEGITQKEMADIRKFLWGHFKTLATFGVNKLVQKRRAGNENA